MELAAGLEDETCVAARYGFEGAAWEALKAWKPFQLTVSQYRTELEANGHTFRLAAKGMAEDLMKDLYVKVKTSDASFGQMMDFLQLTMKAGGLEPQKTDPHANLQGVGPAFTIQINLGDQPPPKGRVIDVTPVT